MAIAIRNPEEFRRLLVSLANEVVDASIYWKLHLDLAAATTAFHREFAQAPAFWGQTIQAHQDAALFRLCKIYDPKKDGISLRSVLETIKTNLHVFSQERFKERMKDNPFVASLAADSTVPDSDQLEQDLAFVSKDSNPVVENLVGLRNKIYAHRASKEVVEAADLAEQYPLTKQEVSELLTRALSLINHYSRLFHAQTYIARVVGDGDHKGVIEAIRWSLERAEAHRKDAQAQLDLAQAWKAVAQTRREVGL